MVAVMGQLRPGGRCGYVSSRLGGRLGGCSLAGARMFSAVSKGWGEVLCWRCSDFAGPWQFSLGREGGVVSLAGQAQKDRRRARGEFRRGVGAPAREGKRLLTVLAVCGFEIVVDS